MDSDDPSISDPAPPERAPETPDPRPSPTGSAVADGRERELDARVLALDLVIGRIVALACSGPIAGTALVGALFWPLWVSLGLAGLSLALGGFLLWLARAWPAREHRHARYVVDLDGLLIRSGVWWRSVLRVTRSRVQHTDVTQGPLERRFGLGTLVVFTAGREHARVELRGLDHAHALAIRDHLSPRRESDAI